VKIGLHLLAGEAVTQYWKFGSPGPGLPEQWYLFSPYDPATDTGAEINGDNIILHFVDGQHGDDDHTADGVIMDPGALIIVKAGDLSLGLRAAPDRVIVGQDVTFTLAVTNRSAVPAPGVVATDPLPTNVAFVSAASSQGTCVIRDGSLVCDLGTLPAGASATIRLVLRPTAPGSVTDTARVSGTLSDASVSDNVAAATVVAWPARRPPRFVTALYDVILDRFPEPHGLAYWVGRLRARVPRRGVARAILDSREHRRLVRQHPGPRLPLRRAFLDAVRDERSAAHAIAEPPVPG
jgi:uncharacterized repeat protein (TIGR01451 family)